MAGLAAKTTVGLCETQPVTAAGVQALMTSCRDLEFVWSVSTLQEAVRMVRLRPPRLVLADKAVGLDGLCLWILNLSSALTATAVVVWGSPLTQAEALRVVRAGAKGVVRKVARPETLLTCLRTAARGVPWLDAEILDGTLTTSRVSRWDLSPRQVQVLELVERGLTDTAIGRKLGIRPVTVKVHLKHIYQRTGTCGRCHLALSALKGKGVFVTAA